MEAPEITLVIDASNVCWEAALVGKTNTDGINRRTRPPLLGLVLCINFFKTHAMGKFTMRAVAPDWWREKPHMDTEDETVLATLVQQGLLLFAPKHIHDDFVILQQAAMGSAEHSYIISNDQYRDHQAAFGLDAEWFYSHRIGFRFLPSSSSSRGGLEFLPRLLPGEHMEQNESRMEVDLHTILEPTMWDICAQKEMEGEVVVEMVLMDAEMSNLGALIGKQGWRIKEIERRYACEIRFIGDGKEEKRVQFRALSMENALLAKEVFLNKNLLEDMYLYEEEVDCKTETRAPLLLSQCIGRQGARIKQVELATNTRILVQDDQIVRFRGKSWADVHCAKQLFFDLDFAAERMGSIVQQQQQQPAKPVVKPLDRIKMGSTMSPLTTNKNAHADVVMMTTQQQPAPVPVAMAPITTKAIALPNERPQANKPKPQIARLDPVRKFNA